MTVQELIKVLEKLPAEVEVRFRVGNDLEDRDFYAKSQLRTAETLNFMGLSRIESLQEFVDGESDDDLSYVEISIAPTFQDYYQTKKYAAEFDAIVGDLELRR